MAAQSHLPSCTVALLALSLGAAAPAGGQGLIAGGADPGGTLLASDWVDGVKREIRTGDLQGPVRSPAPVPVPTISSIDSPSATCTQNDPRKDVCHVAWTYAYASAASSSYMIAMWIQLDGKVVAKANGFFQQSMYLPASLMGNGFQVACGPPVDDTTFCTPPCSSFKVGNSYPWVIRARDSTGTATSNSGTVVCPAFRGADFHTLSPCRILDTRGSPDGPLAGPALQPGAVRTFPISASSCGIPSGAWAVSVNATVVNAASSGHLTLFPGDESTPLATSLSFVPERTRANNTMVPLASDFSGKIRVLNGSPGIADLVLDVNGYFQ